MKKCQTDMKQKKTCTHSLKSLALKKLPVSNMDNIPIQKHGRIFVTIALKRSGQHAVINWLGYSISSTIHLNNCKFIRKGWKISPLPQTGRFVTYQNEIKVDSNLLALRKDESSLDLCLKTISLLGPFENLIYSFENFSLNDLYLKKFIRHIKPTVLLILRDPYNCFASSLHLYNKYGKSAINLQCQKSKFMEYSKQVMGIENFLEYPVTMVDYGKWFCDDTYKKLILERLGFPDHSWNDRVMSEIQPFGGGSSFDEENIDISSLKKRVFERWKTCQSDDNYRNLINDPMLSDLTIKLFGISNPIFDNCSNSH